MTYEEVRAQLAEAYHWTFDEIDDMSFEQIDSACRSGKAPKIEITSAEQVYEAAADWRAYYGLED